MMTMNETSINRSARCTSVHASRPLQAEEEARKNDPNRKDVEIDPDLRAAYYFPTGAIDHHLVSQRHEGGHRYTRVTIHTME